MKSNLTLFILATIATAFSLAGCAMTSPVETVPVPQGGGLIIASSLSPEKKLAWSATAQDMPCDEAIRRFALATRTPTRIPDDLPNEKVSDTFAGATTSEVLMAICDACNFSCSLEHKELDGKGIVMVNPPASG